MTRVLRVPNVDGLGWAPRGREYVAVLLTLDRTVHVEGTEGESWSSATTLSARLGGEEPLAGPVDVNDLNSGTLAIQSGPRLATCPGSSRPPSPTSTRTTSPR